MSDTYQFDEDFTVNNVPGVNAKIFFQVVVDYNSELIKAMVSEEAEDGDSTNTLESNPLGSYDEADEMVKDTIEEIHTRFPGALVKELEPEDQEDEYHMMVYTESGDTIAKLGVIAIDYSSATIH